MKKGDLGEFESVTAVGVCVSENTDLLGLRVREGGSSTNCKVGGSIPGCSVSMPKILGHDTNSMLLCNAPIRV